MGRQTIANVQLLRFLAAVSVLFSHSADLLLPRSSAVWAVPWTTGVDLFFVISGFIMTWLTDGHFGQTGAGVCYLARRIVRIVPAYWFFTALMIATVAFFGEHVRNTTIEPVRIATSVAFVPWPRHDGGLNPILSQGWTLNYEAFFYLCFAMALVSRRGLLLLSAGFIALAALHPLVSDQWFALHFYSDPIILEFIGGIGLARLYLSGVRLSSMGMLACCAAAVVSYVLLALLGVDERTVARGLPALILATGLILAPEPRRGVATRFIIFGGDASYTLYLSHTFTVNAVVLFCRSVVGGAPPVLALLAAVVIAVAVAMLFYRFAEAPLTAWLGRKAGMEVARGPASIAP